MRKIIGNTENWTRGCWVRSANATSMLRRPIFFLLLLSNSLFFLNRLKRGPIETKPRKKSYPRIFLRARDAAMQENSWRGLQELPDLELLDLLEVTQLPELLVLPRMQELPKLLGLPELRKLPQLPGLPDLPQLQEMPKLRQLKELPKRIIQLSTCNQLIKSLNASN